MSRKSVTLSRALKEKNRVAGALASLRNQINNNNSQDEDKPRDIDVEAVFAEAAQMEARLVDTKAAIARANSGIVGTIVALEEVKSEIAWLSELDTTAYVERRGINDERIHKVEAVISGARKIALQRELQKKANALQDQLDEYNASHRVEIEVDD